jgi:hypothetical protein
MPMVRYDEGPFEPLEVRLGGREAFEAHQRTEAERTARVLASRRRQRRQVLLSLLAIPIFCALVYLGAVLAR